MKNTPLTEDYLKSIGQMLEEYVKFCEELLIFTDLSQEKYDKNMKRIKKLIKKLKKGDDSMLDKDRVESAIESGEIPEMYVDPEYY